MTRRSVDGLSQAASWRYAIARRRTERNGYGHHDLARSATCCLATAAKNLIWGYLVECWTCLRAAGRRKKIPRNRFVIFSQGRTGSELLCELLDSHPDIHCDKEILNQKVLSPHRLVRAMASLSSQDTYGFKVKITQLTARQGIDDVGGYLLRMHEDGWKILYLSRRNTLRLALSNEMLKQTHRAHRYRSRDGDKPTTVRIRLDCPQFVQAMRRHAANLEAEQRALAGLPCLRLVYEEDLYTPDQQDRAIRRVLDWLDLPYRKLTSDLVRNTPPRIADMVMNYDELVAAIGATEFRQFLDPTPPS